MSYYGFKKLYPCLYSIHDPKDVYCYLITGEKSAILFDTGYGTGALREAVGEIWDKRYIVILSHGHIDHVNGAYQFDEAWIHPNDYPLYKEHSSRGFRANIAGGEGDGFNVQEYVNADTGNIKMLEEGKSYPLGNLTAETVMMQGHTSGSIGLFIKEHKVLLTSDAANSHLWMFLNESLMISDYIDTLKRVKELDFDTFFVGHSDDARPKSDFDRYIHAAENIDPAKSTPYPLHPELNGLLYKEDDVEIVFRPDKL